MVRGTLPRQPESITARRARALLRPGTPGGITRVQVGSGPKSVLADWWNVDIRDFVGVDEIIDATARWPWSNLDFVYGEHFLEHLSLDGALRFAREAARALRPGGVLRLSTPSLEHVWVTHFRPEADGTSLAAISETYAANRAFHGWGHQFLYSRAMLERLLTAAGFEDLTFHDYGMSDIPAFKGIERHPGWDVANGWPNVWIVEAVATAASPTTSAAGTEFEAEIEHEFVRYVRSGH
jgi:predicted SAM-dependent methyltransferase